MITYEIPKEIILKDTEGTSQVRYQVTIYELGFYIRVENSNNGKDWKLEDITTRNAPSKVKSFLNTKVEAFKLQGYRILKSDEQKVYYNNKTKQYSHARTTNI